jgi:hypothetical protein
MSKNKSIRNFVRKGTNSILFHADTTVLINKLTSLIGFCLQELVVCQLMMKFLAPHGNQKFITGFKTVFYSFLSCPKLNPFHTTHSSGFL